MGNYYMQIMRHYMSLENEEPEPPSYYDDEVASQSDKGIGLFIHGNDYYLNAYLTHSHDGKGFITYPTGYKMATDKLVQFALNEPHNADFLIFPIVFLYRQYLELRLKQLILDGNRIMDINGDFPQTHRIDLLWEKCKSVLNKIKLDNDDKVAWRVAKTIGTIEASILEFGFIDPTSMAFRYPIDKKSVPFLDGLDTINIHHFGESMNNVASYLDAVALELSFNLGEPISMAEFGFNDKLTEEFRKHQWLAKQQERAEDE